MKRALSIIISFVMIISMLTGLQRVETQAEYNLADVGNEWSDWSTTVPEGANIIKESRTEYRYKDSTVIKSTATPATPDGYSFVNKVATGTYTAWSGWSSWSDTSISGNTLRNVQTQSVVASYKTQYNYSRWTSNSNNTGNLGPVKGTWGGVYCGYYFERGWSDSALAVSGTQYSSQAGGNFNLYGNNQWFNQTTRSVANTYKTQYRYQTREEYYNYTYEQNRFSDWQVDAVEESSTRKVETRTTYRFKIKSESTTTKENIDTETIKISTKPENISKDNIVKKSIKVKLKKVTSPVKKKLSVKWKKVKKISGYQMYISLKKNFKSHTFKRNYKTKTIKTTIIGLKSQKIYYVKIRVYNKLGKKKYYGAWSKVKSVQIK